LLQLFSSSAHQAPKLRNIWSSLTVGDVRTGGWTQVDAFSWLNKTALDIIGLTGTLPRAT
jgi:hypothetical protein